MEIVRYSQDLFNTIFDWTTKEVPRPSIWSQCLPIRFLFDPDSHPGHWTQIFLCFLAWFVDWTPSIYQSFWNIASALAPAPLGWGVLNYSTGIVFLSLTWTMKLGLQESVGTRLCKATMCVCLWVTQSCPTLFDPMNQSPPGSSVHECSRREYWRGLPFLLWNLPNPGVEPRSSTCLLRGRQILLLLKATIFQ